MDREGEGGKEGKKNIGDVKEKKSLNEGRQTKEWEKLVRQNNCLKAQPSHPLSAAGGKEEKVKNKVTMGYSSLSSMCVDLFYVKDSARWRETSKRGRRKERQMAEINNGWQDGLKALRWKEKEKWWMMRKWTLRRRESRTEYLLPCSQPLNLYITVMKRSL